MRRLISDRVRTIDHLMTVNILYFGSDPDALHSLLEGTDELPNVYTTRRVDQVINKLLDDHFDCFLIDLPVETLDVGLLLKTARTVAGEIHTVCRHPDGESLPAETARLVDRTLSREETLPTTDVDRTCEELRTVKGDLHPVLGSSRSSRARQLAYVHRDGTYLWVDEELADSVGRSPEELVGVPFEEAAPAGPFDDPLEFGRKALQTGTAHRTTRSDGSLRQMLCVYPIDGDRFLLVQQPAGDRVPFDGRYLDRLGDLFFIVDFDGNFVYWNTMVNEVTGYDDTELLEMKAFQLFEQSDRATAISELQRVKSDAKHTTELTLLTRDGTKIPYQFSASLVEGSDGDSQYVCGIGRDISTRVEMEERIETAIEQLKQSNNELERFAYIASHDLKEPLRTVRSYLDLLERRYSLELDEDGKEFIEFATDGAKRMQSMIDDLLEYSRVSGDMRFERVDCEDVFEQVEENLRASIVESDARVSTDPLPEVAGDRNLLVQLFQNLIDNAIKHADDSPRVHVSAERTGGMWEFAVEDDNDGMTEAEQEDIFELFSTGHDEGGSGIGLATCKKIVDSHYGEIEVESQKGEGSTFYFTLPPGESLKSEANGVDDRAIPATISTSSDDDFDLV